MRPRAYSRTNPRYTPLLSTDSPALVRLLSACDEMHNEGGLRPDGKPGVLLAREFWDEFVEALEALWQSREPAQQPMSVPDAFGLVTSMILKRQAAE